MSYQHTALPAEETPRANDPSFQHLLDTYASEINKVCSTWMEFAGADLNYRPHARSASVIEIMKHQLLSERRFLGEFLQVPEPPAAAVLPESDSVQAYVQRQTELAKPRLDFLAQQNAAWWTGRTRFFDVERERIWIFWRRVLHTAHHRTQLTVYLRLLDKPVPATYGPTADVSWDGADPTLTVEAASRR